MLAYRAMAQGVVVAEVIAGHRRVFDGGVIPAVCFTDPEIATVGLSPEEARKAGHQVHTGIFPFRANGRALTLGEEDGFVRGRHGLTITWCSASPRLASAYRNWLLPSVSRLRWARGWKISAAPSMPI